MPPILALCLWVILLVALFHYEHTITSGMSAALWVPLIWMFFTGSRLPSFWLGTQSGAAYAVALESGNSTDRNIYFVLIFLALGILLARSFKWGSFFSQNIPLMLLLFFGLLSILWSDFALIAFKRWFRDLGNFLVVLVVLSDRNPSLAVSALLRRLCYLLISLSILLIKYFPTLSRSYDRYTGVASFTGAATSKNMLGVLCLLSGLVFLWDSLTRWRDRKEKQTRRVLFLNAAFIAMTLWLMNLSSSATSKLCLVLGSLVLIGTHSNVGRPVIRFLIPTGISIYIIMILVFGVDINAVVAETVGRDPTLTDRTLIWETVLDIHTNPLLGCGYESFWLGPRLLKVWQRFPGINEAHNGYLQMYLQLGLVGVALLGWFLITSYPRIWKSLKQLPSLGSLTLALWIVLIFYNISEAAFGGGLLWLTLLLGVLRLGGDRGAPAGKVAAPRQVKSQRARVGVFQRVS